MNVFMKQENAKLQPIVIEDRFHIIQNEMNLIISNQSFKLLVQLIL